MDHILRCEHHKVQLSFNVLPHAKDPFQFFTTDFLQVSTEI